MPLARLVDEDGNDIKIDNKYLVVKISDGTEIAEVFDGTNYKSLSVILNDGTENIKVLPYISSDISSTVNALVCNAIIGAYDGSQHRLVGMDDATNRNLNIRIREGGDTAEVETTDGGDITNSQKALLVINLNYVWDSVNEKWVPMTQP